MPWRSPSPLRGAHRSLLTVLVAALSILAILVPLGSSPAAAATTHPVMAATKLSAADLAGWYRSTGKTNKATVSIDSLAGYFVQEGTDEGVAGDIAFAQSIVETGYFNFSTRVPPSYNNFSGLGAVDGGTNAAQFPTARTGVRAQIQHLRAYGDPTVTEAKLHHPLVDPRFNLVSPKGKAPTWEQFGNGIWATDPNYSSKVLGIYAQITSWAKIHHAWDPFATPDALVAQGYRDLLYREATSSQVSAWVGALKRGDTSIAGFLAILLDSEGKQHALPVTRLYLAALGRLPDRGGLSYWTRRHAAGDKLIRLAQIFVASSEFTNRFGHPDNAGFVDLLYQNVLGRPGDSAGRAYWTKKLNTGAITRAGLVVQFSESSEFVRKSGPTVEAADVYLGMLLRRPTTAEIWTWTDRRANAAPLSELTGGAFTSAAYRARFS
jgi:hypothetical protein